VRITERGTTLVVQDTPGCFWLFGLWFVAGGALALAMPFIAVNRDDVSGWAKALSIGIGVATVAAGLFVIRTSPSIRTEIDPARGRVRVTTRVAWRAPRTEEFALGDVGVLQVLPARDSDGDTYYTLRLLLADGRAIPLHRRSAYGKEWIEARAARIRQHLAPRLTPRNEA
jgi:hypothetical protein